jgi:hypothetical protein
VVAARPAGQRAVHAVERRGQQDQAGGQAERGRHEQQGEQAGEQADAGDQVGEPQVRAHRATAPAPGTAA